MLLDAAEDERVVATVRVGRIILIFDRCEFGLDGRPHHVTGAAARRRKLVFDALAQFVVRAGAASIQGRLNELFIAGEG